MVDVVSVRLAPDAEDFVVSWLKELEEELKKLDEKLNLTVAVWRDARDEFPSVTVARVAGGDDPDTGLDVAVVQIDVLEKSRAKAAQWAQCVDAKMKQLATQCPPVTLYDGTVVACDFCDTILRPFTGPYPNEDVTRYIARYEIGLSYRQTDLVDHQSDEKKTKGVRR